MWQFWILTIFQNRRVAISQKIILLMIPIKNLTDSCIDSKEVHDMIKREKCVQILRFEQTFEYGIWTNIVVLENDREKIWNAEYKT